VEAPTEEYFQALREINFALIKGLETAVAVLENPEKFTEQQRQFIIDKMRELIESSQKAYGTEETKH
jgi:hypothetical protein